MNPFWWFNWIVITPLLLLVILCFNIYFFENPGSIPKEISWVGWVITAICLFWIPVGFLSLLSYHVTV